MTNELEKLFFQCFGIEPRYEDACTVEDKYWDNEELANEYGTFDQYMNCKCGDQENCTTECSCAYQREVYPTISDSILLELICICSQYGFCPTARNIKDLKLKILKRLFKLKNNLKNKYEQQGCHNAFVRKVRTLFEKE